MAEKAIHHQDNDGGELDDDEVERVKSEQVAREEAEAGEDKGEVMDRMKGNTGKPTQQVHTMLQFFTDHHL